MKRLLVLFVSLFLLSVGLFALPLYPNTVSKLPLTNGHTLEVDFYAPKDALPFFDQTILTNGFIKLLADTKLSCDFSIVFMPRSTHDIEFSVSFDNIDAATADAIKPAPNSYRTRCLPLLVPRDALMVLLSWYNSYLTNQDPAKTTGFVQPNQPLVFHVFYGCKGQLSLHGKFLINNIMSMVPPSNRPIFDPAMIYTDLKTFNSYDIKFYNSRDVPYLTMSYGFVLDPIVDPSDSAITRTSVLVYKLFGMPTPE